MKMKEVKAAILRNLYAAYEAHGAGGCTDLAALATAIGVPENTTEAALTAFHDQGLVDYAPTLDSVFDIHLTAAGIEAVEEPGTEAFDLVQHVHNVSVHGGSVQFGNNNTQNITYSTVLENFRERLVSSSADGGDKGQLLDAIDLLKKHPFASSKV